MSDSASGSGSTPSRDAASLEREASRLADAASTDNTSARSASAEADSLHPAASHVPSANPLETGIKTTAIPGEVTMSKEVFQDLVDRARAGGAVLGDVRDEVVLHPSFKVGGSSFLATVKVWFGSPLAIPEDLVRAFNAGNNIPLSLLTVAAIRDHGINQRRSVFQPKMTGRLLEEFGTWHSRDEYLPFAEWCQAIFTLIHLFRSVRAVPQDETQEDDPIFQLTEHALAIISRANAYAWPVYREYDKRVRQEIWSGRITGAAIPFRINTLHTPTLDDAEMMIKGRNGALADFAAILDSGWSAIVTAQPSEIAKLGRRLNEAHSVPALRIKEDPPAPLPPALGSYSSSRSGTQGKRKAADEADMAWHPARSEKVGSGKASFAPRVLGGMQGHRNPTSSAISGTTACSAGKTVAGLGITAPGTAVATSSPREFPLAPAPVLERLRPTTIRDAFSCVSTTLHAPHFQHAIDSMPLSLRSQYAYIPASIRAGFSMGPLQPPVSTILHPNHYKADRQLSVDSWASKSKAAGFIAGPWPVEEVVDTVGPIHAAPISIVDKFDQGVLVKERIVYDASYPQPRPGRPSPSVPSINSQIRKDDYPCEWMTAVETKHLFRTVPPYARFAGFD
ncbi:hypothetical protein A4X13_0g7448, partial [Tilletia indica]